MTSQPRCEGVATRRAVLRAGGIGLLGLSGLLQGRAAANPAMAAGSKAKSCILIFQWGGPSHLDTWDPKPDAPDEIRGPFKSIETSEPGVRIGEHFPLLAKQAHRYAIVRSMTHSDPAHLSPAHHLLTGQLAPRVNSDADGPSLRDWPCLGATLSKFKPSEGPLPKSVTLPWLVSHPAAPGGRAPGQHASWLGKAFEPMVIEGDPNAEGYRVAGLDLPEGITPDRVTRRRGLLEGLEKTQAKLESAGAWDGFQARALDSLSSATARDAFKIDKETPEVRDRYGRHIHGQCLLMARRLVESGVSLVTVNWPNDGQNFWDTHGDNFNQLQNRLMPPADRGFAALLDDLSDRGLLDSTLVIWIGEFGRTPRILRAQAGREHWPRCYSAVLAGGGVQGGRVYGSSDRFAAYPASDPVGPADISATILWALGVDPAGEVRDPLNRPIRLCAGEPLRPLFA